MVELTLEIGGKVYANWQTVSITKRIDALATGFHLECPDAFALEDLDKPCRLLFRNDLILTGFIDHASRSGFESPVALSGRSKTADIVDSSVVEVKEYLQQSLVALSRQLVKPFGLEVIDEAKANRPFEIWRVEPQESVFETLQRAAAMRGVLLRSDPMGRLVITPPTPTPGSVRLVERENLIDASVERDRSEVHSVYIVRPETHDWNAPPAAKAEDKSMRRYRPKIISLSDRATAQDLELRANWERAHHRGRSLQVKATVHGWTDPAGELWEVNTLVGFSSKRLGIDTDLLVSGVEFTYGEDGTLAKLQLTYPDGYALKPAEPRGPLQW